MMTNIGQYGLLIIISVSLIVAGMVLIIKYVLSCESIKTKESSQIKDNNKHCPNCGIPVSSNAEFCRKCGTEVASKKKKILH